MSRTRLVNVRFDLANPEDALTYTRLKESSRRAGRTSIALQARHLLMIMLEVRLFEGLERTGLTAVPDFPAQAKAFESLLSGAVKRVAARLMNLEKQRARTDRGGKVHSYARATQSG